MDSLQRQAICSSAVFTGKQSQADQLSASFSHSERVSQFLTTSLSTSLSISQQPPSARPYRDASTSLSSLSFIFAHQRPCFIRPAIRKFITTMAIDSGANSLGTSIGARLAYTVLYVPDVTKSVEFYQKAFGLTLRVMDESKKWAEFDTGPTTLAMTPLDQREVKLRGGADSPDSQGNMEIAITVDDVDVAFKRAKEAGATIVAEPEAKPWGQTSEFLRDIDGNIVRVGDHVSRS